MNITIHRDGQNYGPYTLNEIRQHLAEGSLVLTDLAFAEGASDWVTLDQIPGVKTSVTATSPPPPKAKVPIPVRPVVQPNEKKGGRNILKSCLGCAGLMIVGLIVLAVIGALGGKANRAAATASTSAPTTPTQTTIPATESMPAPAPVVDSSVPQTQQAFISIVDCFKVPYDSADTEIKKTNVRFNRKDALTKIFTQAGNLQFQGWTGQVTHLTTESDGAAYIAIQLTGTNIVVQTNNNSVSDAFDHTMIPRSDALYQPLMDLKEGDQVIEGSRVA